MSYILDALRRAQAERERGQVPGLHAQPGLAGAHRVRATASLAAPVRPAWVWALGGAGLLALLLLLLWWALRGAVVPAAAVLPAATAVVSAVVSAVVPAPQPAPITVLSPPPAPLVVVSAAPAPPPSTKPATKLATGSAAKPAASTTAASAPASSPTSTPSSATTTTTPTPATSSTAAALPPAMTPEQRRDWPALSMGGSVWSDTAAARFVILGGQVVREGDTTADGVLVERITPKAVVLRWRDQRASLPF